MNTKEMGEILQKELNRFLLRKDSTYSKKFAFFAIIMWLKEESFTFINKEEGMSVEDYCNLGIAESTLKVHLLLDFEQGLQTLHEDLWDNMTPILEKLDWDDTGTSNQSFREEMVWRAFQYLLNTKELPGNISMVMLRIKRCFTLSQTN